MAIDPTVAAAEAGTWRETLRRSYAPWFDELYWGFQCGDGWQDLVVALVAEIAARVGGPQACPGLRVVQLKEKFGTLRCYIARVPEPLAGAVQDAVLAAERRSAGVCEACGAPARLRETPEGFWYTTCEGHATT